ncbi:glycosyltransferase family 4 protein [Methanoculleus taiwanensis]|uniref:glycosyltransferase family 4 protein n=1 Tax=Methanoculleus taiwanensis TaxID=1550565 RepID=UPI000FFE50F4|nr:glycosyltransferase family 4 protein [Methanoculleus taiwanensis]
MKLCILSTGYLRWKGDVDSAKNYLEQLANNLADKGLEVHVIAPHAKGLKHAEKIDNVNVHRFQYMFPPSYQTLAYFPGIPEKMKKISGKIQIPFFGLSMTYKLLQVCRKHDIDIIFAHWAIPPGFIAALTKYIHKRPIVIGLYGAELFPFVNNQKTFASLCKIQIGYAIRNSDLVIGISKSTCNAGKTISRRMDIETIPYGVDIQKFNPTCNPDSIKQCYGLESKTILFSTGRMVERKGFKFLVDALPLVLETDPNTILILGGDGPEKERLKKQVADLNLEEKVIFPGFIPDEEFPNFLTASDVFILPSIVDRHGDTEGLGLVLVEAMACGTPVIGTNVGGITDIITHGYNGFLVPEKSSKDLAERIVEILSNPDLASYLNTNGLSTVQNEFSWESVCKKYLALFNRVS